MNGLITVVTGFGTSESVRARISTNGMRGRSGGARLSIDTVTGFDTKPGCRASLLVAGDRRTILDMTPESLGIMLSDFLIGSRRGVLVEDSAVVFDLAEAKY